VHLGSVQWFAECRSWRIGGPPGIYIVCRFKELEFASLAVNDTGLLCATEPYVLSCQTCTAFIPANFPCSIAVVGLSYAQLMLRQCQKEALVVVWRHESLREVKSHHLMRPPRSLSMPVTLSSRPRFFLSSSLISSSSRIKSSLVIGATKFSSSTAGISASIMSSSSSS
jgi:hypothetical protein